MDDAVFIIGGFIGGAANQTPTIAKFSDGTWSKIGDLQTKECFLFIFSRFKPRRLLVEPDRRTHSDTFFYLPKHVKKGMKLLKI